MREIVEVARLQEVQIVEGPVWLRGAVDEHRWVCPADEEADGLDDEQIGLCCCSVTSVLQ